MINDKILKSGAAAAPFAGQNFKHIMYTGDNSSGRGITGVGFKPDLIMIKPRNQVENWNIYDSTRGATKQLIPNTGAAESTQPNTVQSFDTDGFTLNGDNNVNKSGINYSAWCWKANGGTTSSNGTGDITSTVQANTAAGFSIVKYTGNGTATQTIGHGLSSAPEWLVVKQLNSSNDWVWKNDVQLGAARGIYLNDSAGEVTDSTFWQSASPTSTVFTVGTSDRTNDSGADYIAYCWHNVSEFSNSTTGSQYIGTGDSDGPTINLGFEPSIIIIKSKDGSPATNWLIYTQDTNEYLSIDNTNAAAASSGTYKIDFLSNGFKVSGSGSGINNSGQSYNYYCWATDPDTEAPTLADSFNIKLYTGNNAAQSITGLNFSPGMIWFKNRTGTNSHALMDVVRGRASSLYPDANYEANTSAADKDLVSFDADGFTLGEVSESGSTNTSGGSIVAWAWKANDDVPTINDNGSIDSLVSANANAGFSIVKYDGAGSAITVGHGLSAAPTFMIVKAIDGGSGNNWVVYHTSIGNTKGLVLDQDNAEMTYNWWNGTTPTATVFSLGTGSETGSTNNGSRTYIAYCFHDVTGYSKFGTYSGSGSDGNAVSLGFQPDFVMIKRTNSTGAWLMFDSARNTSNPRNNRLEADKNDAATTGSATKNLDFNSTDFEANGSDTEVNASGSTYIYMAFKMNLTPVVASGKMAYLVLAGGASGASNGGGGGAGGLRTSFGDTSGGGASAETVLTLSNGTYTITIGGGGAGLDNTTDYQARGNAGSTSTITGNASVSTNGGGAPGSNNLAALSGGGCGGGQGAEPSGGRSAQAGTTGEGYAGGATPTVGHPYRGGGGGGTGQAGFANNESTSSNISRGGDGLVVNITGSSVNYGAGGGGTGGTGSGYTGAGGTGGTGGGGNGGAYNGSGTAGTANTGSGGGATGDAGTLTSGAGGSGLVILRMRTADYSGSTTGSPTVTTVGEETILKYTGSGTYVHS